MDLETDEAHRLLNDGWISINMTRRKISSKTSRNPHKTKRRQVKRHQMEVSVSIIMLRELLCIELLPQKGTDQYVI